MVAGFISNLTAILKACFHVLTALMLDLMMCHLASPLKHHFSLKQ